MRETAWEFFYGAQKIMVGLPADKVKCLQGETQQRLPTESLAEGRKGAE